MYWHKKIHSLDWSCQDCEIRLNRKWNFKRHLLEVHGLEFHEIDDDSTEKQMRSLPPVTTEEKNLSCSSCKQNFASLDDLKEHLSDHTLPQEKHTCVDCGKTYTRKEKLLQHIKMVHLKEEVKFSCQICGMEFNRKHNLTRHEKTMHGD